MNLQFQTSIDLLPKQEFELKDGLFVRGAQYKTITIRKPVAMDSRLADAEPNPDRVVIVRDAHYFARLTKFNNLEMSTTAEMILNLSEFDFVKLSEYVAMVSEIPLDHSGEKSTLENAVKEN